MIFGYMRISTQKEKQTTDRQKLTLENYSKENNFKYDEIIEERISGTIKANNRPKYSRLKAKLREDDILIITDIDRLGRNADDVIMEFKQLKSKGIRVIALDTPHLNEWNKVNDSSIYNMIADIFITLKAHIAQQEREKTVARINQGIEAMPINDEGKKVSIKTGNAIGRPRAEVPEEFIKEYKKFKNGEYGKMSATNFAKMLGIGRSTMYKYQGIIEKENIDRELIGKFRRKLNDISMKFNDSNYSAIKELNKLINEMSSIREKSISKVTKQLDINNENKKEGKLILNSDLEELINKSIKLQEEYINRFKN